MTNPVTPDEQARNKLGLWFFRDLTDDDRFKLFRLFGMPDAEITNLGYQSMALAHIVRQIAKSPSPETRLSGAALRAQYEKDLTRIIDEWEQRREVCLADPEARARFLILRSFDLARLEVNHAAWSDHRRQFPTAG